MSLDKAPLRWNPPAALESGDSFADRSPPGIARSNLNLGMASLRSAPQQPSNVATVPQIAPPRDGEV